jgi:hypothetical protein
VYLETRARSAPYIIPDFYQACALFPYTDAEKAQYCVPVELKPKAPVEEIVKRLNSAGVEHLKAGTDAGMWTCEFLLYTSVRGHYPLSPLV